MGATRAARPIRWQSTWMTVIKPLSPLMLDEGKAMSMATVPAM